METTPTTQTIPAPPPPPVPEYEYPDETTPFSEYPRLAVWVIVLMAIGVVGTWLAFTPSGVLGKADAVGYAICHRIEGRSFSAFGRQLPLCARCSGIYLGVMTTLGILIASGRARVSYVPNWKILLVLATSVVVLAVDGGNSYFHLFPNFEDGLYEPHNNYRLVTGMFFGMTFITLLLPVFNATVWRKLDRRAPFANLGELAGMIVVLFLVIGAVLTEQPLILLVGGIISTIGVVLMLTLVFSVMFINLFRRDRTYNHWPELWLPMLGGLTMAILMIGLIDLLRFFATGTWDGFVFDTY